jgi:outer membrane protein TolC
MNNSVRGLSTASLNWLWIIVIGAIVVGCHMAKGVNEPSFREAPPFRMSGTEAVGELWWTAFGDSSLDQQVREALEGSLTLTAARERVQAANALARRESSALFPELEGTAGVSYRETDSSGGVEDYELGAGGRL